MKIILISDTHGKRVVPPEGDMIIHGGDLTTVGHSHEVVNFLNWFSNLPHKYKICIGGNHDFLFQRKPNEAKAILKDYPSVIYLQDSGVEIEGIKIWGSPWTPAFLNWAFMYTSDEGEEIWSKIPDDTNILITHGPPYGIMDLVNGGKHVGCHHLLKKLDDLKDLKLHVFGNIHEQRGELYNGKTTFINASVLTDEYTYWNLEPFTFNYE